MRSFEHGVDTHIDGGSHVFLLTRSIGDSDFFIHIVEKLKAVGGFEKLNRKNFKRSSEPKD